MDNLVLLHDVFYKNAVGNTTKETSHRLKCNFCGTSLVATNLYRHRIVCRGLPEKDRVEADPIATRYSSARAIRNKLSKYCFPIQDVNKKYCRKYGEKGRVVKQRWPVAFVNYIKLQVRSLPKGQGHDVRVYFQWWENKDIESMPVLGNPDMYKLNSDHSLAG